MNVEHMLTIAILIATLGTGIIGGAFFAFSTFVMRALARLPASQGIAAMQNINITVLNRWFLGVFLGTAVLGVVITILAITRWSTSGSPLIVLGALLYVLGTFVATMVFNVPKNNVLAALRVDAPGSAIYWKEYLERWTFWNHVRTICALAGTVCLATALALRP
jgi:uncharacterized membrane protein